MTQFRLGQSKLRGMGVHQALLDLAEAMGWSDRLEASLVAGLDVIKRFTGATLCPVFMLMDDPDTLVRVADDQTSQLLGPYFETMPADEHAHPPWLNREMSPVCAADHLSDPAWQLLDPAFRAWFGSNGVVAPIVGDRRHIGAVLVSFDDSARRLTAAELDFLNLAGRMLGNTILRLRKLQEIRRNSVADERRRLLAGFEEGMERQLQNLDRDVNGLATLDLDGAALALVAQSREHITVLRDLVIAQVLELESGSRSEADSFSRLLAREVDTFASKWAIPVQLELRSPQHVDSVPTHIQEPLQDLVAGALADIRERASANRASVQKPSRPPTSIGQLLASLSHSIVERELRASGASGFC